MPARALSPWGHGRRGAGSTVRARPGWWPTTTSSHCVSAALKLCPLDPAETTEWLLHAGPAVEELVALGRAPHRAPTAYPQVPPRCSSSGSTTTPPTHGGCSVPDTTPSHPRVPTRRRRPGRHRQVLAHRADLPRARRRAAASASSPTTSTPTRTPGSCAPPGCSTPSGSAAVETGACPHTAIRDDVTANLLAVEDLEADFAPLDLVLVESGGDNLTATFSPALVDAQIFVLDVAGGGDVARKGGPGIGRADLLVVNKTDLAPYMSGSTSSCMRREGRGGARRAPGDRAVANGPQSRERAEALGPRDAPGP